MVSNKKYHQSCINFIYGQWYKIIIKSFVNHNEGDLKLPLGVITKELTTVRSKKHEVKLPFIIITNYYKFCSIRLPSVVRNSSQNYR